MKNLVARMFLELQKGLTRVYAKKYIKRMIVMTNETLNKILKKLGDLTNEQQQTKQAVGALTNEQQQMKQAIDGLTEEQQQMKQAIDGLAEEQQQIKRAVMETNESVKRLESIQNSQHRIIELLSTRSIEQEAEIKRIK